MSKSANKTAATGASVPAYVAAIGDAQKRADAKALIAMMRAASGEKPVLWGPSIIGFGSHHYVYDSGREGDVPVVAFSPRKAAMVLYLSCNDPPAKALLAKLGKHSMGKGCLYIKRLADVDEAVLKKLIARSVAKHS